MESIVSFLLIIIFIGLLKGIISYFMEGFKANISYSESELISMRFIRVGYLGSEQIKHAVYKRKKIYRVPDKNGIYRTINEIEQDLYLKFYSLENLDNKNKVIKNASESGKEFSTPISQIKKLEEKALKVDLQQQLINYWNGTKKKSKEEIGRDYERYIGYLYEQNGYKVTYQGIRKKMEDGGIDLICQKGDNVDLVQCKNWGKDKIIHEKHINQLYGACSVYMKRNKIQVNPVFYTNITLSDEAKSIANELGVVIIESVLLDKEYPSIKCNIGKNGEKIFHVPWSPYYDNTRISKKGECYVKTIKEAEELGFKSAI